MCASVAPLPCCIGSQPSDLLSAIESAFAGGLSAHGDLSLSRERYAAHLLAVLKKFISAEAGEQEKIKFITLLHTEDLYLARACAEHGDQAWRRFDALYHKYLNDLIGYLCSLRHVALDLMETLIIDLFLPDRSGQSRICSYDGRSSLATWLRVVVTNRIINEGQRKSNHGRGIQSCDELPDGTAVPCLEKMITTRRYEAVICESLRQACDMLSPREKKILLWRFDEGLQLGDIAGFLRVHQSTITRTLDRIARKLHDQVIASLSRRQLDCAAIEECISLLVEGNAHSISILDLIRNAKGEIVETAQILHYPLSVHAGGAFRTPCSQKKSIPPAKR